MTVRRLTLITWLIIMGAATAAALMARGSMAGGAGTDEGIAVPARTADNPPPIPPPPSVPAHADTLPPLTFDVETTRLSGARARRTTERFVRTGDRVRVLLNGGRQEWLFLRNAAYRDRVSGYFTDHTSRTIRFYDESPLRSEMGIRGWLDVLAVRFELASLAALHGTGERRQRDGTTFGRYVGGRPGQDGVVEVWWSDPLLLPLSFTVRHAGLESTSVVRRIAAGADVTVLADPAVRFSTYKRTDAADAEGH
jgi:hypothetical protein